MSRPPEGRPAVPASVVVLEPFVAAGVFDAAEVQLAATVARLEPAAPDQVLLALALAARGPRLGHVCVEPAAAGREVVGNAEDGPEGLPWPAPDHWSAVLAESELVADPSSSGRLPLRPLVWDGRRLYLHRYWHHESAVAERLLALATAGPVGPGAPTGPRTAALAAALDLAFPPEGAQFPPPADRAASTRADTPPSPEVEEPAPCGGHRSLFSPDRQRLAAERALTNRISVIAGGPGTGKTRTVAGLLEAAHRLARWEREPLQVALAAPTGKAAARLSEAVAAAVGAGEAEGRIPAELAQAIRANPPTTLHRLLGPLPGARFRHDRHHPLPHDLIVVDEASMVSLPLMSALLAAARPDARLVLVGDPSQLASVEAGSVLRDVVGPLGLTPPGPTPAAPPSVGSSPPGQAPVFRPEADQSSVGRPATDEPWAGCEPVDRGRSGSVAPRSSEFVAQGGGLDGEDAPPPLAGHVTLLSRVHRFSADSAIAALAEAIRAGDGDRTVQILRNPSPETAWIREDDHAAHALLVEEVVDAATEVVGSARTGEALVGLRAALAVKVLSATRAGVQRWSERIERGVASRDPRFAPGHRWYIGRPVMVTENDRLNQLANGDVGLVVRIGGRAQVGLDTGGSVRFLEPARLGQVDTWWAMTIHKSQGSEFAHAVIALPDGPSPILSRELLYTAVTRARKRVTVVGSEACVREAVARPVARASGLGSRLWPAEPLVPQFLAATPPPPMPAGAAIHQDRHTPPVPSRT